jgi:hypothetical protein
MMAKSLPGIGEKFKGAVQKTRLIKLSFNNFCLEVLFSDEEIAATRASLL